MYRIIISLHQTDRTLDLRSLSFNYVVSLKGDGMWAKIERFLIGHSAIEVCKYVQIYAAEGPNSRRYLFQASLV